MTNQTKPSALAEVSNRIAYVVTDLNGLISRIVNDEISLSDFDHDQTALLDHLAQVEGAVGKLADVFWQEPSRKEGGSWHD